VRVSRASKAVTEMSWDTVISAPGFALKPCDHVVSNDLVEYDSLDYLALALVRSTIRFGYVLLIDYFLCACVSCLMVWTIIPQKFGGTKRSGSDDCSGEHHDDHLKIPMEQQKKDKYSYTVLELSQVFLSKYRAGSVIDSFCRVDGILLLFSVVITIFVWACQRYNLALDMQFEHMIQVCSPVNADREKDYVVYSENQCKDDDCIRSCSELHCDTEPRMSNVRTDKPYNKQPLVNKFADRLHRKSPFVSADDGRSYNEATMSHSSGYYSSLSSTYSQNTFKSQIVGLQRSNLAGMDSVPDKAIDSVHPSKFPAQNVLDNTKRHSYKESVCVPIERHKQQKGNDWGPPVNALKKKEETVCEPVVYTKPAYAVLIGDSVKVYDTTRFASLPNYSKFMVKERQRDSSGTTRVKLALKCCKEKRYNISNKKLFV